MSRTKQRIAALEHALTQLQDIQAGFPERELHETLQQTITRIQAAIGESEQDNG